MVVGEIDVEIVDLGENNIESMDFRTKSNRLRTLNLFSNKKGLLLKLYLHNVCEELGDKLHICIRIYFSSSVRILNLSDY